MEQSTHNVTRINIEARVTYHPDSGNYFLRFSEDKYDRAKANGFISYLEAAFAELNNGNEYFGSPNLNVGDNLKLSIEIEHKQIKN